MIPLWNRYRKLLSGKWAGFTRRVSFILLLAFALLGNTFAHAHHVHLSLPPALSHQLFSVPGKTEKVPAQHDTIACSCLLTVLPRTCSDALPATDARAVKHRLDLGAVRRSMLPWDYDPPPRA